MEKKTNRKGLVIGIAAAVLVLAALLALVLTQCGGEQAAPTAETPESTAEEIPTYTLYWNLDLAQYAGKSEAGMSSRTMESDGYFHVRFFVDGEIVTMKVADRKLINQIDFEEVMGLEFDENGNIIGVVSPEDMPLEMIGWRFYVQSAARTMIKLNSSEKLNGMEILLEDVDPNRVWDMTGRSGEPGCTAEAIPFDRVMVVQNFAGEITHVYIVDRPYYMATHEGYCKHCEKDVTWNEWVRTDVVPLTAGHYQLQTDVQLKGQASMAEDAKICLDLNGHRIDGAEGKRVYSVHNPGGALAIMDTSEGAKGVIAAHGENGPGGMVVWPRYGAAYLYEGTLDGSDAASTGNGTTVYVPKSSYFYMYGGEIIGGTSAYTHNPEKNTYGAGLGGSVVIAGKFVMDGGVIRDGFAQAATYYKNGSKTYSRGFGGNIYISGTGEFEMNDGVIKNGHAGNNGGNIYADGACTVTIKGGSIQGGRITGKGKNGGNLFLTSKSTTTISGGSITGGSSRHGGGNIYLNGKLTVNGGYIGGGVCYDYDTGKRNPDSLNYNIMLVNGKLNIYGGTIQGGVAATDSKKDGKQQASVYMSGFVKICDGPNGYNLYLSASGDGVRTRVGTLHEKAKISVNTTVGIFTEPTKAENKDKFLSDIEGAEVVYYNECLALGKVSCICGKESHQTGCDGTQLLWAPWTSTTSLPKTTGNYFLLSDVTATSQTVVTAGNDVKLDLNGHNATYQVKPSSADGFRLYRAEEGGKLSITDTTGKPGTMRTVMPGPDAVYPGTTTKSTVKDEVGNVVERVYYTEEEMRAFWAKGNSGMVLWSRGGEINVHGGIFDGSNLEGASYGMTVLVNNRTVTDAVTGEKTVYYGQMNIYGGTIIGGYTKEIGNVNIVAGATLNMYGGTIRDGRANRGGNIAVAGTFNMYGGAVTGGIVDRSAEAVDGGQGGNINVESGGVMNLLGGTVEGGCVKAGKNGGGQGGNIHVHGTLSATGGIIRDGNASAGGGNIATISADSLITLDGVQVLDGTAAAGGNILIGVRSNKGLYLLGETLISGGHATSSAKGGNGGNIAVNLSSNSRDQDQLIVIDGATIQDGTSVGTGGNIRIRNLSADAFDGDKQTHYCVDVVITMRSGTISGGQSDSENKSAQNGGSIYLSENSSFILEGGTVTGGDCSDGGGNFYVNGTLDIRGGTVTGGTRNGSSHAAANIFVVDGALALSGGTVDGNVTVNDSSVTLSGKPVVNKGASGGITLQGDVLYAVDGLLQDGSCIYTNGSGYISKPVEAGNEAYLHSVDGYGSYHNDGRIFLGKVSCLCGKETHTQGCVDAMAALGKDPTQGDKLPLQPLTAVSDMSNGGYWYLPKTITSGATVYIKEDKPLVLDLNGQTLNADHGSFLFSTQNAAKNGLMVITDTATGGAVKLTGTKTTTAQGGILRISGKSGTDVVYLLGGTLDASGYPLASEKLGGAVAYITNNNAFKMYGGTVIGRNGTETIAAGSAIHVRQGTFQLLGGTVTGGKATNGGNVYIDTNGTLTMSGGSITGGAATAQAEDLYVLGSAAITGGRIGGMYAGSDGVSLTGSTVVDGLNVAKGKLIDVGGLTGTVTVTAETGRSFAKSAVELQAQTNVVSADPANPVLFYASDRLYMGKAVDIYCICGATLHGHTCQDDGNEYLWTDWTATDALPSDSGYYRLTGGVSIDSSKTTTLTNQSIYLDLNGQIITLENGENLYNFTAKGGAKLVITDTSKDATGKAVLTGSHTANGGFADILAGNTVELYRATLDASGFETAENGAVFAVRGSFVMHSGKVIGGEATGSKKNGGALWMAKGSQVTIHDGIVEGGKAGRWGGAIYVTGSGTKLTMNGGTVKGGEAAENGGVIIVRDAAVFEMKGGAITGSNLFVDGTGVFTMTGGSVTDAEINGNKATVTGNATVTELTINAGMVVDLKGLTGTVTVTAEPGQVFATGTAEQIGTNIISTTQVSGFTLPILLKETDKLYLDAAESVHCICGASLHGYECQDDGKLYYWQPWTEADTLPSESGYYRLTGGVTLTTTPKLTGSETIYLDLNGQTVTQKDMNRLYNFDSKSTAKLIITDSSKDGKGGAVITGTRSGSNGGLLDIPAGVTFELYRATLDASQFHVAGGNGTAISTRGTIVMHSGTIKGGSLDAGTKHGATLWVVDGAQMTMKDGLIVGGRAGRWGGTMYINAANTLFKMEGGRIEGGTSDLLGGSLIVRAGATLHMTGGVITGGKVTDGHGWNVYVYDTSSTFRMEGGEIHGGVYSANNVTLSGNAVIDKSLSETNVPAYSLQLASGKTAKVTGLTGKVFVTAEPGACFATGATAAQANVNVLSETKLDDAELKVLFVEGGKLHMGAVYCICGASLHGHTCQDDGTQHLWTDWTSADALPSDSGYYRLTGTVNMDAAKVVTLSTNKTIYLDLNGQTIDLQNGENLYTFTASAGARVVITDTSKNATGKVILTGSHTANGGITEVTAGNTLEVYRATFDASEFTLANNGTVFSVKGGTCVMHSGKLIGGRVENGKNQKNGGTLWVVDGAQMTMKGGTVVGGYADKWAGALYVNAANTLFKMEGGTIEGGSAQLLSGNVMVRAGATFHMTGGTITGGSVVTGGEGANVYVYDTSSTFRMEGGKIHGGVYSANNMTLSGNAVVDKSLSKTNVPAYSLKLASGKTANVSGLTGKVYITAAAGTVFATGAIAAQAETNVISEVTGHKVVLTDSTKLTLTAE